MTFAEEFLEQGRYYDRLINSGCSWLDILALEPGEPETAIAALLWFHSKPLHERAIRENWHRPRLILELCLLFTRGATAMLGLPSKLPDYIPWPDAETEPERAS